MHGGVCMFYPPDGAEHCAEAATEGDDSVIVLPDYGSFCYMFLKVRKASLFRPSLIRRCFVLRRAGAATDRLLRETALCGAVGWRTTLWGTRLSWTPKCLGAPWTPTITFTLGPVATTIHWNGAGQMVVK